MSYTDTYITIEKPTSGLFKDKGSKFISFAYPISNESSIKPIIDELKKEHHSARHHCYAWRLGIDGTQYRANDDGEPSGTAGRPILGQLISKNITNILVVVVRYFGGTLLGVSGLINAYKNATEDVLNNATAVEKIVEQTIEVSFEYHLMNSVMKIAKEDQLEILDTHYGDNILLKINVRSSKLEKVRNRILAIEGVEILDKQEYNINQ